MHSYGALVGSDVIHEELSYSKRRGRGQNCGGHHLTIRNLHQQASAASINVQADACTSGRSPMLSQVDVLVQKISAVVKRLYMKKLRLKLQKLKLLDR